MSETITAGKSSSFYLNAGNALTIVAASGGTATALRQQQQDALELLERTRGALLFGEALLARLQQPEPEPAPKGDD